MAGITRVTTGRVRLKRGEHGARRYLGGGWRSETLPVHAFLVEHAEGLCLFDTGQTARAAAPGYFPRWHPFFRLSRFELAPDEEAAPQLRALGVSPEDVRWVVLSHLHTDHCGGVGDFRRSQTIVSRAEWKRALGLQGRLRGYLPQYWPHGLEPRVVDLPSRPVGPFARSLDLTDDGTITLVATPGHTAGHLSLLVRTDERTYLLGGDLAHDGQELRRTGPAIAAWCNERDVAFLASHDDAVARAIYSGRDPDGEPACKRGEN